MYLFFPMALLAGIGFYFMMNYVDQDAKMKTSKVRKTLQAGTSTGVLPISRGAPPEILHNKFYFQLSKVSSNGLVGWQEHKGIWSAKFQARHKSGPHYKPTPSKFPSLVRSMFKCYSPNLKTGASRFLAYRQRERSIDFNGGQREKTFG